MKRATSLLTAALSVAVVAAAGGGTCNKREGMAPPPAPTAHWLPSPNVTLLGVPRSVEKELLALNATGKQFECKDSRKTKISFDKVNDGYCDCPENGADEPGTAACAPQGLFYCRNKGFVGKYIPSSRAFDNVCDCCDGTDEIRGRCPNNCTEIAAVARAARAEEIALFEAGAAKKKEYVKEAAALAEARIAELAAARAKYTTEEGRFKTASAAKEAAEAAEKQGREARLAERVAQLKAGVNFAGLGRKELRELYEKLKGRHGKVVAALLEELRKKLGIKEEAPPAAAASKADEEEEDDGEDYDPYPEVEDEDEEAEAEAEEAETAGEEEGDEKVDASLEALLELVEDGVWAEAEAAKTARSEFYSAQADKREAEKAVEELEKLEGEDFGPDQAFAPLKARCVSRRVNQYTYEICPYKEAYQKEGDKAHGTSLGKWAGLERVPASADGATPETYVFKFTDGQPCWNGPRRSMTVAVSCGAADEVLEVDEPSMCTYTAVLRTPAACAAVPDHLRLDLEWENEEEDGDDEGDSPRSEL